MEFRKKKEEHCITSCFQTREVGNAYSYLGYKRDTQFFIGFAVGKWNELTCNKFYSLLAKRMRFPTRKRRITIFSDGNKQNVTAIETVFPQGTVNYACKKKIKAHGKIVGIIDKVIFGNSPKNIISITQIDGFCSKLRERISCFTRKARSFAKKKICIEQRLEIFSIQHNFIETKRGLTPAMKEGLSRKPLTWDSFFNVRLTTIN